MLKFIGIPDELGHYGSEDTFLMFACELMKQKNYDVQQYILNGLYIAEDKIYKDDTLRKKFVMVDLKKINYIKHNTPTFAMALQKFSNNLKVSRR